MTSTRPPLEPDARRRLAIGVRSVAALLGLAVLVVLAAFLLPWPRPSMAESQQPPLKPAPINATRAFGYLQKIVAIGPRPAGSEANARQRQLVAQHFKTLGATVREQPFQGVDPLSGKPVSMVNLIGSWFPERNERVVIACHYDTRPFPDEEPNPNLRNQPFLGANDGASGVALLMEMAHHLTPESTPWGVDLVLFDGEELVYGRAGEYFLGSKAFARKYASERRSGRSKSFYAAGIVLDMVAGKNLHIPREPYSLRFARGLVNDVWGVAHRLEAPAFVDEIGREVLDDHLALNDARIPTIDIIDFGYAHWHTAEDLPENCSAASLAQVGRVVTAWLSKPIPNGNKR